MTDRPLLARGLSGLFGEEQGLLLYRRWLVWKINQSSMWDRGFYCPANKFMCTGCAPLRHYFEEQGLFPDG